MGWDTFWAIFFSQTHLVTLAAALGELNQGCKMVFFETHSPKLGIFLRALEWKM
jgi:hypothetical protein